MNETIQGVTDKLIANFEKVASVYDIPAEYHEEAKTALIDEIVMMSKQAGFGADVASSFGGHAVGKAALGLGVGALTGLGSMAVKKIGNMFGAEANRASYDRAFRQVMEESELLQNDPMKAKRMADTIFGFAPTVASDPNVLSNILNNSIHGDSMDLQTVRAVTELEEKIAKIRN
jgi:hypothetical protein